MDTGLILDLKNKKLYDQESKGRLFDFNFTTWNYEYKLELFYLDENLEIHADLLEEIIFDPEKYEVSFEADYDEDYIDYLLITSGNAIYNEDLIKKSLQDKLEDYIYEHPFEKEKGELKGKAVVYYDYENRELNVNIKSLHLSD